MEITLRRRHALMVKDGAFNHKIDYVTIFVEILNLKGHQNCITGSRVTPILLNGWILPIVGASAVEGLLSTGRTPSSCTTALATPGLLKRSNLRWMDFLLL